MPAFVPIPYCFDYYNFAIELEIQEGKPPGLLFFAKVALVILGLLWFHMNFMFVLLLWNLHFDRDCNETADSTDILQY